MAKEIERKFLVKSDAWRKEIGSSSRFRQAYIALAADRSVRVRILDDSAARLTIKLGRELLARDEFEYDLPVDDACELVQSALGIVLEKTRHRIRYAGYVWEVDVYEGAYRGLIVAEVEIESEDASPDLPEWIGAEITGDRRYSNAVMATEDLSLELVDGVQA